MSLRMRRRKKYRARCGMPMKRPAIIIRPNISITHRRSRSRMHRAAISSARLFYGSLGIQQSDAAARVRQTSKNYGFFGAPVGLIIAIDRRLQVGSWLDLGMFIQNVMIAAGARGLQTCPQETFSKYHALLRTLLPIPSEEIIVCGMSIGFAEDASVSAGSLMPKAAVERIRSIRRLRRLILTGLTSGKESRWDIAKNSSSAAFRSCRRSRTSLRTHDGEMAEREIRSEQRSL